MEENTQERVPSRQRRLRGPVDILILMGALVNALVIAFFLVIYFRA
jgi:hypothetical protein